MAQYDVYPNPQPATRAAVPYVVDVQSALIDTLATRLVMPLSRVGASQSRLPTTLCPVVQIGGETLTLMPHLAAPLAARSLREPVDTLSHRAGEIAAAVEAVLSGV